MDIKDIQEQAFERGRIAGRREAIEERLAVLKGVEVKELVAKAETVLEDLLYCSAKEPCRRCYRYDQNPTYVACRDELMRDAYAVIKALLCGGAEADASATGASGMPRATGAEDTNVSANCGNCANFDREKGEFTQACGVCKVMRGGAGALSVSPSPTCAEGANVPSDGDKVKLEKLLLVQTKEGVEGDPYSIIADHMIANGVTVQEWISVKDRLPEKNTTVIAATDSGIVFQCLYAYDGWDLWEGNEVNITHWIFLPKPPKGE